jgi:hypothetical protein
MEPDHSKKRTEVRFLIEAGATIEVTKNGQTIRATTVNMSAGGVLLHFEEPVELEVGDQVICEFRVSHEADESLPNWGLGNVVRVEDCRAAIKLKAGGLSPLESETDGAVPGESEPGPR